MSENVVVSGCGGVGRAQTYGHNTPAAHTLDSIVHWGTFAGGRTVPWRQTPDPENPSRLYIPRSGVWLVGGTQSWAISGIGERDTYILRTKADGAAERLAFRREEMGATIGDHSGGMTLRGEDGATDPARLLWLRGATSPTAISLPPTRADLEQGDYIELWGVQTSGGDLESEEIDAPRSPMLWAAFVKSVGDPAQDSRPN